jgi:hypothetical protein
MAAWLAERLPAKHAPSDEMESREALALAEDDELESRREMDSREDDGLVAHVAAWFAERPNEMAAWLAERLPANKQPASSDVVGAHEEVADCASSNLTIPGPTTSSALH